MEIILEQKKLSIPDRFRISIDQRLSFSSKRGFFSYKINVLDAKGEPVAVIRRKSLTELNASYVIEIKGVGKYQFETSSWKNGTWKITGEEEEYLLYEHEGFNYSVYKNDIQIAKGKKNDFVILGGDRFKLTANEDENTILLITMFLVLDNAFFSDRGFRFGYSSKLTKDGKKRDWNWKPNAVQQ